jgi:hypothetical protein
MLTFDETWVVIAFDLIELNGDDLRRDPLEVRKATLSSVLARAIAGLHFNEHLDHDNGPLIFAHACKLGFEGIVSKRRVSSLPLGALAALDQEQERGMRSGALRGRGRLGALTLDAARVRQTKGAEYAEDNALVYAWKDSHVFGNRQRGVAPEQ